MISAFPTLHTQAGYELTDLCAIPSLLLCVKVVSVSATFVVTRGGGSTIGMGLE